MDARQLDLCWLLVEFPDAPAWKEVVRPAAKSSADAETRMAGGAGNADAESQDGGRGGLAAETSPIRMGRRTLGYVRARGTVGRMSVPYRFASVAVLSFVVVGCASTQEPGPAHPEILPPPTRTAAEDADLRRLLRDVLIAQICPALERTYAGLPDGDAEDGPAGGASPSGGRLWIRECETREVGDLVSLDLGGPGWVWMNQSSSGFEVRDYLRLAAEMHLVGEVDLGYARDKRVVSVWFTPRQRVTAKVRAIGEVPVRPESVLAKMAAVLPSVRRRAQEQAQESVVRDGSAIFEKALQAGFTVTLDLCTGQVDSMVGALGDGQVPERPYPPDEHRWLANERTRIRAGGLDAAGPWRPGPEGLRVDLTVEEGPGAEVRVVCADDAEQVVDAFLFHRDEPPSQARAAATLVPNAPTTLEVEPAGCPVSLLIRHHGSGEDPVVLRYRVRQAGDRVEPIVRCDEPAFQPNESPAAPESDSAPTSPSTSTPSSPSTNVPGPPSPSVPGSV